MIDAIISRYKIITLILFIINVVFISVTNAASLLALLYTCALFYLVNRILVEKKFWFYNFCVFQVLLFIMLAVFFINKLVWPDWLGLGLDGGFGPAGTDSPRFYLGLTSNFESVPEGLQNSGRNFWFILKHPYVKMLKLIYPFSINHPLSILILNILALVFIPYFTYKVAMNSTKSHDVAKLAYVLVIFCPMLLTNGVILVRDGWTALFTIMSLFYAQEKKYFSFLVVLFLVSYLRTSTGILVFACSLLLWKDVTFKRKHLDYVYFALALVVVVFIAFVLPSVIEYIKLEGISFGRDNFVESFIGKDKSSTTYMLYTLPMYIRFPASFTFFFCYPYLSLGALSDGVFNIRGFLAAIVMPLVYIVYFRYMIAGMVYSLIVKNKKGIEKLVFILFIFVSAISMISLQLRHRTAIMPLYYILVAYGFYNSNLMSRQLGRIFVGVYVLIQLVVLFK